MATIGGNLYTRHPKNLNHVHIDSNDITPVIIILGTDVNGGETVFYDEDNMNDANYKILAKIGKYYGYSKREYSKRIKNW